MGERDKALSALAVIYEQQSQAPLVSLLRSKALNVALECWLADPKTLDQFTEPLVKFALTPPRPPNRLDADWLSMKYRAALALDALAKYTAATTSLQTGLRVNQAQPDARRHSQLIWNAVLELPDIDPAISRMQQQLRQRMGGNQ